MKRELFKARSYGQREAIIEFIRKVPETEKIGVEIFSLRDKRSLSQNNLYWLWLTCIEQETGTHRNFYHEYFTKKYLPKDSAIVFGRIIEIQPTTTSQDTKQFSMYLENIRIEVEAELGIMLPDPKDKAWEDFYKHYRDLL